MSFDLAALRDAVARHGRVARVVVAATQGSAPREVGAAMLVWNGGQSGTIGGGALEWEAAARALEAEGLRRVPLGPGLGQCCGGAVTLLTEHYDATNLPEPRDGVIARGKGPMPLAIKKMLASARNAAQDIKLAHISGWMVEPVSGSARPLWIYGAGHVGRALAAVLSPLPGFAITWVDTAADRFPDELPDGVTQLIAANPADAVAHAPDHAEHLILTYSHALDLELCHRILGRPFAFCGLIGSATKKARFRTRLRELGHSDAQISRICCPIGQKSLGKHPQAIAVGVAASLLSQAGEQTADRGIAG